MGIFKFLKKKDKIEEPKKNQTKPVATKSVAKPSKPVAKPSAKPAAKPASKKPVVAAKKPVAKSPSKPAAVSKTNAKVVAKPSTSNVSAKTKPVVSKDKGLKFFDTSLNDNITSALTDLFSSKTASKNKTIDAAKISTTFDSISLSKNQPTKIINEIKKQGYTIIYDQKNKDNTFAIANENDLIEMLSVNVNEKLTVNASDFVDDGLRQFLIKDVSNSIILSVADEAKYVKMLKSRNPELVKIARHKLNTSNLRLIMHWAIKYQNRGLSFEDLLQEGSIGLNTALDKFDYKEKVRFSTYATWWIRQQIQKAITDKKSLIRIPVHMNEYMNTYQKKELELQNELGRNPTNSELEVALNKDKTIKKGDYSAQKIAALKKITSNPVSLEKSISTDEDSHIEDFIKDNNSVGVDRQISSENFNSIFLKQMHQVLTEEEEEVICMRYGINHYKIPMSLEQIAKHLGITKEKARQIEQKAIRKMRGRFPDSNSYSA